MVFCSSRGSCFETFASVIVFVSACVPALGVVLGCGVVLGGFGGVVADVLGVGSSVVLGGDAVRV